MSDNKPKIKKENYLEPYPEPNTEEFYQQLQEAREIREKALLELKDNESKIDNIQKTYNDAIKMMNIASDDHKDKLAKREALKQMNQVLKELNLPILRSGNTSTHINKFTNQNTREALENYIQKHGQKDMVIDKPNVIGKKSITKTIYDIDTTPRSPKKTEEGSPMLKRASI